MRPLPSARRASPAQWSLAQRPLPPMWPAPAAKMRHNGSTWPRGEKATRRRPYDSRLASRLAQKQAKARSAAPGKGHLRLKEFETFGTSARRGRVKAIRSIGPDPPNPPRLTFPNHANIANHVVVVVGGSVERYRCETV